MQDEPIQGLATERDAVQQALLDLLLTDEDPGLWSHDEIARAMGDPVVAIDATDTLHAAGLLHQVGDFGVSRLERRRAIGAWSRAGSYGAGAECSRCGSALVCLRRPGESTPFGGAPPCGRLDYPARLRRLAVRSAGGARPTFGQPARGVSWGPVSGVLCSVRLRADTGTARSPPGSAR